MTTVAQAIARLEAVGGPNSGIVVWQDLCRRSITPDCVWDDGEGGVVVDSLSLHEGVRDELISKLSTFDHGMPLYCWISGCMRTFGVVSYDELDDTITIKMEVV